MTKEEIIENYKKDMGILDEYVLDGDEMYLVYKILEAQQVKPEQNPHGYLFNDRYISFEDMQGQTVDESDKVTPLYASQVKDSVSDEEILINLPENSPLYKDSGLWQIRSDDMEEVIIQQAVNESDSSFLEKCRKYHLDELDRLLSTKPLKK